MLSGLNFQKKKEKKKKKKSLLTCVGSFVMSCFGGRMDFTRSLLNIAGDYIGIQACTNAWSG